MSDAAPAPDKNEQRTPAVGGDFLTKEALTSGAHFKQDEDTLNVPELGGKLKLRAVSFREARAIRAQLPETLQGFKIKHTAFTLSKYVITPALTEEEWTKVLSRPNFPDKANQRIQAKIAELMDVTDEEETRVADEFPGADD